MSGLINKVKEAISSDKKDTTHDNTTSTHNTHTTTHNTTTHPRTDTTHDAHQAFDNSRRSDVPVTEGSGSYALGNEVNRGVDGPASKTDGPHKSNLLNKIDPRVDSDNDKSKNMGINKDRDATTTNTSSNTTSSTTHGSTTHGGSGLGSHTHSATLPSGGVHSRDNNIPEGTAGPHSSRMANAADPRVDSDLDSSRRHNNTHGTTGLGHNTHNTSTTHGTTGLGHNTHNTSTTHGTTGLGHNTSNTHGTTLSSGTGPAPNTAGPHKSDMMNKADPRVDSDLDSSRRHENTGMTGTTGLGHNTSTTHGTSGLGHNTSTTHGTTGLGHNTSNTHGTTLSSGTGPAPNTAGPHSSDMMNKADPRVDSNLDGSKTVGGNKTYDQASSGLTGRDPTDAAQVPPSVMQKHIGRPSVEHDDIAHDRERRHSTANKESHHGL